MGLSSAGAPRICRLTGLDMANSGAKAAHDAMSRCPTRPQRMNACHGPFPAKLRSRGWNAKEGHVVKEHES
jgi:hypothetical protein